MARTTAVATTVAVILGAAALGVALRDRAPKAATVASCGATTPKLTVQGTGQATVTPDLLTVSVEVDASAASAAAALASDDRTASGAVAAFESGGVSGRDVQTSGLSLQPQYAFPNGVPMLTGYQVANSVTATIHRVSSAGSVIDGVVGSAGDALKINSISFSVADPAAVEDQARARAVAQAVTHAETMAAAAGRELGPVCSLTDETQLPLEGQDTLQSGADQAAAPAATVPIESGSQIESAQISLTYSLEPGLR
jgi:hypothetical protein